jgi:hypothetical protein
MANRRSPIANRNSPIGNRGSPIYFRAFPNSLRKTLIFNRTPPNSLRTFPICFRESVICSRESAICNRELPKVFCNYPIATQPRRVGDPFAKRSRRLIEVQIRVRVMFQWNFQRDQLGSPNFDISPSGINLCDYIPP